MSTIRFDHVSVHYADATEPTLTDVDFEVDAGELCLVVGSTGSGKSTLLKAVNGLVPHFTGGTLSGRVLVAGRDTRTHRPRDLADAVGYVGQDPLAGFVTDTVEDELAYGMESLGIAPDVMRRRVEEVLDLLGLAEQRARPLLSLSAGQQQRVALASVLTMHPQVLVLDEPTSALDPPAAEEVLAALTRLVDDLGLTVLLAEHRLERVLQYADRIVVVPGDGRALVVGNPREVMATSPVAPPVVRLGRLAGWQPLPLSVRDARRASTQLRSDLEGRTPRPRPSSETASVIAAQLADAVVAYDDVFALRGVSLSITRGSAVAVMGRNGAGKSSLLSLLAGLQTPTSGKVMVDGAAPAALTPRAAVRKVALVPQEPGDLLWADSVAQECRDADRDAGASDGSARALLEHIAPGVDDGRHPRDLSEGQRLALALAVVLAGEPPLLLLDEPTRGLDYAAKERLVSVIADATRDGRTVVFATHDVELVAEVASRVVVLADGEVVSDGPTDQVVTASPAFAPQVAKVLAPLPWLTVGQVAEEIGA